MFAELDANHQGTKATKTIGCRLTAALQIVHGLAFDESSGLYQRLVIEIPRH